MLQALQKRTHGKPGRGAGAQTSRVAHGASILTVQTAWQAGGGESARAHGTTTACSSNSVQHRRHKEESRPHAHRLCAGKQAGSFVRWPWGGSCQPGGVPAQSCRMHCGQQTQL